MKKKSKGVMSIKKKVLCGGVMKKQRKGVMRMREKVLCGGVI